MGFHHKLYDLNWLTKATLLDSDSVSLDLRIPKHPFGHIIRDVVDKNALDRLRDASWTDG